MTKTHETKVWIAYRGEYSDRHVVGVFSSREKLNVYMTEMQDTEGGTIEIDEWELDALMPPVGMHSYLIAMTKEGDTTYVGRAFAPENDRMQECQRHEWYGKYNDRDFKHLGQLRTVCWARDEEHAIKIANERRAAYLVTLLVTVPTTESKL